MKTHYRPCKTTLELNLRTLLILFIVVPILEMWVLIEVGGVIGALPTIGLVFLTAFVGLGLLRIQGASTLLSAREKMQANKVPAREIIDGIFYAVGGVLLLTPGFITDVIGFACLTPGIRTWIIYFFFNHLIKSGRIRVYTSRPQRSGRQSGRVIEGDFKHHSDE